MFSIASGSMGFLVFVLHCSFSFELVATSCIGDGGACEDLPEKETFFLQREAKMKAARASTQLASTQPATWNRCAYERETCQCSGEVRYGHGDTWSISKQVDESVECSNGVFGDPLPGQPKECQCYQAATPIQIEYLVVAGAGGGGSGGGGAGGVLQGTMASSSSSMAVVIGAGGASGTGGSGTQTEASNGQDSSMGTVTAIGGGKGAGGQSRLAGTGGSGGGGGFDKPNDALAEGTSGQGNAGGRSDRGGMGAGGGGGGAGQAGANPTAIHYGGKGGDGIDSSICGTSTYYGGGGGGGVNANGECANKQCGGSGGRGGGGHGSNTNGAFDGTSGTANTGGGGGGTDPESSTAGSGGSGIVIVRYTSSVPMFTGGDVTANGGYQIHTFTTSGTLVPLVQATWRDYFESRCANGQMVPGITSYRYGISPANCKALCKQNPPCSAVMYSTGLDCVLLTGAVTKGAHHADSGCSVQAVR